MYAAVSAAYCSGEMLAFNPSLDSTTFPARDTYQVVQLNGANTLVDTRDDLLCDSSSINMLRIKAVAKSRDTRSDLIELYAFFASVWKNSVVLAQSSTEVASVTKIFEIAILSSHSNLK